jgi:sulfur-oxidizing protein SoxX
MYRFGRNDLLKPEQIADVVAYLLDPASEFNTKPALKK